MTKRVKLRSIADCTTDLTAGELSAVFSAIERADAIQCDRLLYCEVGVFKGGTFVQAMRKIDRLEYARPEKRWDVVGIDLFEDWPVAPLSQISAALAPLSYVP